MELLWAWAEGKLAERSIIRPMTSSIRASSRKGISMGPRAASQAS